MYVHGMYLKVMSRGNTFCLFLYPVVQILQEAAYSALECVTVCYIYGTKYGTLALDLNDPPPADLALRAGHYGEPSNDS